MKTVLYSHIYLDCDDVPGYRSADGKSCRRLERFVNHYHGAWPIEILDNGSNPESVWFANDCFKRKDVLIESAQPHLKRGHLLDYPAVWRAYNFIPTLFADYEKVIFVATDAYMLSQRLADYVESLDSGWTALWSPKYKYPATEIQVIVRGASPFEEWAANLPPPEAGERPEEELVPLTHVEKGFVGDRYSEYNESENVPPIADMDWIGKFLTRSTLTTARTPCCGASMARSW